MTGKELKLRRRAIGASGMAVTKMTGISRSRLSDIERDLYPLGAGDQNKITLALDRLGVAHAEMTKTAQRVGWLDWQA